MLFVNPRDILVRFIPLVIDFTEKNRIIVYLYDSTFKYNILPTLYKRIIKYLDTMPIGGITKREGHFTKYDNHLVPVIFDSNESAAAAAAIGESLGGPNIGT